MKTLVIGLGTLMLVALTRPALAQRCLSFRAPAFFGGVAVAPGYPYPAYGYPVYPYPLQARYKGTGDPNNAANFRPIEP